MYVLVKSSCVIESLVWKAIVALFNPAMRLACTAIFMRRVTQQEVNCDLSIPLWANPMTDNASPFSATDEHWMRHALSLAQQASERHEVPVGAVIVRDGQMLGEGFNQPISGCDPTAHAEIVALRAACASEKNYRLPGATLYVTIEPCAMCAGALVHARIERVVFGAVEPKAGAAVSTQRFFEQSQLNHRVQVEGGCLADACSERISDFFKSRREQQKALKARLRPQDGDGEI